MTRVRVVLPTDPTLARRWRRHLAKHAPDVEVGGSGDHDVVVTIDGGVAPPPWTWLTALLATLDRFPEAAAAQPLLVDPDVTVTSPVGRGLPVSGVESFDGAVLPGRIPGALARRVGADGDTVLATGSWLVGEGPELLSRPAPTGLRWSIDVAAPAAPLGRRWGDWHFARSLADALGRLGQDVVIDHPETRGRASRSETDVVLVLRGLERVAPVPGAANLLWVISHPGDVTPDELAAFDVAFAAGTAWAARHGVRPLLQCTDTARFHPGVGTPGDDVLFVGNARGGPRPVVMAALAAGVPVTVIGAHWERYGPSGVRVEADGIANEDLPARYAGAGVVLGDHHDDMRVEGFVSNRVFDVLAVGGRLLGDDVAGLADVLGADLPVWRTADDVGRLARPPFAAFPSDAERVALAERVVAEHSFDARARTLFDAALGLLGPS